MLRSFKFRLYPNPGQQFLLVRHFGACRWVYNEALAYRKGLWEREKRSVNWVGLNTRLPGLKELYPWLKDVTAQALQSEVRNLHSAYEKFFREKKGYPKFKNKFGRQRCQFPQNTGIDFDASSLRLPKIGHVRYADPRTFTGQIKTVTVSRDPSGKFYASILVENGAAAPVPPEVTDEMPILGIDLGLKHFATLSSGEKIDNPKFLRRSLAKLRRAQQALSRKKKGSSNRAKARQRVALAHEKVRFQRTDFLQKVSSKIISENQAVAIEDLNVKGMVKNRRLARSISDAAWAEFVRMLDYKATWYGRRLIRIGRFDPSSRLCTCGRVNRELTLADREWTCISCGATYDRDILAATNISRFARQYVG